MQGFNQADIDNQVPPEYWEVPQKTIFAKMICSSCSMKFDLDITNHKQNTGEIEDFLCECPHCKDKDFHYVDNIWEDWE